MNQVGLNGRVSLNYLLENFFALAYPETLQALKLLQKQPLPLVLPVL